VFDGHEFLSEKQILPVFPYAAYYKKRSESLEICVIG
jgi:hypothetical protein